MVKTSDRLLNPAKLMDHTANMAKDDDLLAMTEGLKMKNPLEGKNYSEVVMST